MYVYLYVIQLVRIKMTKENGEEKKALKCPNKKCGYEWEYKGSAPFYTSCPRCRSSVKVKGGKKWNFRIH
jgi:hypothetical protein